MFFDRAAAPVGFELGDKLDRHLLVWKPGRPARVYAVRNDGFGVWNTDHLRESGRFDTDGALRELDEKGGNLTAAARDFLRAGLLSRFGHA